MARNAEADVESQARGDLEIVQLPPVASTDPILKLHFRNVSYDLKAANKSEQRILYDACGTLHAGRLTAILGPSGAGKSTMLNVLAGFKVKGVSGTFELNDQPRNLLAFRKISSYIPQDFVMLSLLTVEETLQVSADLKLPRTTPRQQKRKILDDIIEVLNLQKCRNTLVRNLSGGERKRLSIGIELVTNPPIMFFDEPTSGLDSVASYQVMCYLQRLAHSGRIVLCVVHQPSSRLMQLFDDVLVVAHGEVLYSGDQSQMFASFERAGFSCPKYYNPADFVLEVGSESSAQRCDSLIEQNKERHATRHEPMLEKNSSNEQTALMSTPANNTSVQIDAAFALSSVRPKEQVSVSFQLNVLLKRYLCTMSRNLIAVQLRIIMHVLVALLLGVVYWQIGNDAAKVMSNVSCLFFVILFVFCGNAMPSILLCQQDAPVFLREYYNSWYSLNAYYIAKVVGDFPLQLTCPTLFVGIAYFMTGQPPEMSRLFMCWCLCIMTAFIGHFIGIVAGSLLEMQVAVFVVPAISIPFLLFSGFFIRLRELSWFLRPICDISFFRYIFEGLLRAIYGYGRGELPCRETFCFYKTAEQFLEDFDMLGDEFGWDMTVLAFYVLLLLLSFYITLHVCIKRAL